MNMYDELAARAAGIPKQIKSVADNTLQMMRESRQNNPRAYEALDVAGIGALIGSVGHGAYTSYNNSRPFWERI